MAGCRTVPRTVRTRAGICLGASVATSVTRFPLQENAMGNVFKRTVRGKESPVWQLRYRVWDAREGAWGKEKFESAKTANRREAESLLRERELREERRRLGIEPTSASSTLGDALTGFLDETQAWDAAVPERNRVGHHPVLGIEVRGTGWWIRTLDFAGDVLRHFGDGDVTMLAGRDTVAGFDRFLVREGGARGRGVGASTRHKVLTWLRRFCRWCVVRGYLPSNPVEDYAIPREQVQRRDRIVEEGEQRDFWTAYGKLSLKARARVGLVLFTGARAGEIDTILAGDVSPERRTVRRRLWKCSRADGPREVVVKIPAELMETVVAWIEAAKLEPSDRLFPVRCQAGVKFLRRWGTSMRGLRRTVLTRMQDAGTPLRVIQEAAGHAKLDTTQRYLGVGETAVNTALSRLSWDATCATESATDPGHQVTTGRGLSRQAGENSSRRAAHASAAKLLH
ncbi:MAG: tyrosine-type recombinase/integrase [Deltaproteobacteria bacterium]